jgi:uncharacterized protein
VILRDPVHGLLAFESEETNLLVRLLETAEVQRLRRIRQLGVTSFAYPGAEHTRFAHALGTAHVMQRLLHRLRDLHDQLPFWQRVSSDRASEALAAALLHDIGHGPLSHLFETTLPSLPTHEVWSSRLLMDSSTQVHRVLSEGDPGRPQRVSDLIHGKHELPFLANAVSGTFDVDRCDYLLRDAHATGVRHGYYDLDWLLHSLCFRISEGNDAPSLAIDGAKGLVAIEEFVLARLFMFQQVYFHKCTRAAEFMIRNALSLAVQAIANDDNLEHVPHAFYAAARHQPIALDHYVALNDTVLWQALEAWENAKLPALADICQRVRTRNLFKTIELFGEAQTTTGRQRALQLAQSVAESSGLDPAVYVGLDVAEDTPFSEAENPPMVVLHNGPARRLSDMSFLLRRLDGESVSKVRLICAPELRPSIKQALRSETNLHLSTVFGGVVGRLPSTRGRWWWWRLRSISRRSRFEYRTRTIYISQNSHRRLVDPSAVPDHTRRLRFAGKITAPLRSRCLPLRNGTQTTVPPPLSQ